MVMVMSSREIPCVWEWDTSKDSCLHTHTWERNFRECRLWIFQHASTGDERVDWMPVCRNSIQDQDPQIEWNFSNSHGKMFEKVQPHLTRWFVVFQFDRLNVIQFGLVFTKFGLQTESPSSSRWRVLLQMHFLVLPGGQHRAHRESSVCYGKVSRSNTRKWNDSSPSA